MKKDSYKTQVLFRYWRKEIIALFPYLIANYNGNVESYQHVGQHGGADYLGIIQGSRPATKKEYKDLKKELESLGYNLEQIKKRNYDTYLNALKESR